MTTKTQHNCTSTLSYPTPPLPQDMYHISIQTKRRLGKQAHIHQTNKQNTTENPPNKPKQANQHTPTKTLKKPRTFHGIFNVQTEYFFVREKKKLIVKPVNAPDKYCLC